MATKLFLVRMELEVHFEADSQEEADAKFSAWINPAGVSHAERKLLAGFDTKHVGVTFEDPVEDEEGILCDCQDYIADDIEPEPGPATTGPDYVDDDWQEQERAAPAPTKE